MPTNGSQNGLNGVERIRRAKGGGIEVRVQGKKRREIRVEEGGENLNKKQRKNRKEIEKQRNMKN